MVFLCLLISVVIILSSNKLLADAVENSEISNQGSNRTLKLIEKIRRQLMKDNYDYLESEDDVTPTVVDHRQLATEYHDHRDNLNKVFDPQRVTVPPNQYNERIGEPHDRININSDPFNVFSDQNDSESNKPLNIRDKYADNTPFKQQEFNIKDYLNYPDLQRSPDRSQNHMNEPPNREDTSAGMIPKQIIGLSTNRNNGELHDFYHRSIHPEKDKYPKATEYELQLPTERYKFHKQAYGKKDAIPRAVDYWKHNYEPIKDHGFSVSQRDLLYYMDDKRMRRKGDIDENQVENATSIESDYYTQDVIKDTPPTAKYKLIKVKAVNPSRRNMAVRRFVEEKKEDGVAIYRLDDEPFPQFALPRSRRQYMFGADMGNDTLTDSDSI